MYYLSLGVKGLIGGDLPNEAVVEKLQVEPFLSTVAEGNELLSILLVR